MKIAILTLTSIKIGGLATQAFDFVRLASELGHESDLINIELRQSNEFLPNIAQDAFGPDARGKGLKLKSTRLGSGAKAASEALAYLEKFDICVWVGVAPHLDLETDKASHDRQVEFWLRLLNNGRKHIAFATDRFIDKYYAWVAPHLNKFAARWAFAEPYQKAILQYASCDVVPIAPLDAWNSRKWIAPSSKPRKLFWPHQFRTWKNPQMFCEIAPKLNTDSIRMYATGAGVEFSVFSKSDEYKQVVKSDVHNPAQNNPNANLELMGFVPLSEVMKAYEEHSMVADLTGVSAKQRLPNSYIGNYQVASFEPMLLGTALIKFTTTVSPHNCIPKDCVLPLEPGKHIWEYAETINGYIKDLSLADKAAKNALEWIQSVGNPQDCFRRMIEGTNKTIADKAKPKQMDMFA